MNAKQESTVNMFDRTNVLLISNAAVLSLLPDYMKNYNIFNSGLGEIQVFSKEQMFDKSGLVKNKEQHKQELVIQALDVSKKLQTFARFTNNQLLLSEITYSESDLKYVSNLKLKNSSQGIYDRALANVADLENYGITSETLATFITSFNVFIESIPKASIDKAASKENTAQLATSIKSTIHALKKIDAAIEIIRLKEPKFYNAYKNLRKIIGTSKGSMILKGNIIDADTKQPVKNANIVFSMNGNGKLAASGANGAIVKTSALKGGFSIKSLPNGMYNVVITKNGYSEQKTTIAITNGELAKLNVELLKN